MLSAVRKATRASRVGSVVFGSLTSAGENALRPLGEPRGRAIGAERCKRVAALPGQRLLRIMRPMGFTVSHLPLDLAVCPATCLDSPWGGPDVGCGTARLPSESLPIH